MLFVSGGLLMAQDTIKTLVITEAKMDRADQVYIELTNMGTEALNLKDFEVGRLSPWDGMAEGLEWPEGVPQIDGNAVERLPDFVLAPGESYVIGCVHDFTEEAYAEQMAKFGYSPDWGEEFLTHPKMWDLIDLQVHRGESPVNDPRDSISSREIPELNFNNLTEVWNGRDTWYIRHQITPTDSAVIDQIGWIGDEGNGTNPDAGYVAVAGVTDATGTHYLMRRFAVKQGNTEFVTGVDYDDSEWIPVPGRAARGRANLYNERLFQPFWTIGNHVNATLDETTLVGIPGSTVNVNWAERTIDVPWGVRNQDSIMFQFEYTPGLAWHYDYAPSHEDSAYSSVRTGDSLTIYACGDVVQIEGFILNVLDPPASENRVVPMYNISDEGDYVGTGQRYEVSDRVPGMDTIREIPFACRLDSLYDFLEKAPNADWEIVWVDDNERTDLMDGDLLRVTADDGSVKDYYLKLQKYRKARNADLSAIRWPDIPDVWVGSLWDSDTIPNFNPGVFNYALELPPGQNEIPGLVAKNQDDNARHTVDRAVSLLGDVADRTITFHTFAEDDTTIKHYKVVLKVPVAPGDIQPWEGEPFISQFIFRSEWANSFIEFINPSNTGLLDMSDYMFVTTTVNDIADAISRGALEEDFETPEDYYNNRYNKYIPGRVWADTAAWDANPGTVDPTPDGNVNTIVFPGDVFVMGDIANPGTPYFDPPTGYGDGNWPVEEEMDINFGTGGKYPCPWIAPPPGGTILDTWYDWHWLLYKIVGEGGDSVKNGTKAATDPDDFVLIDMFAASTNDRFEVGGQLIDQIFGFTRKPHIYKGNTIYGDQPGGSFGTDPESSEWIKVDRPYYGAQGYGWAMDILMVTDGIGAHFMDPVTVGISTVSSYQLSVSKGFSLDETIDGSKEGHTVTDFLAKIKKKHPDQTLIVKSGGAEITGDAVLTHGDSLVVMSADMSNTSRYHIEVTADGTLSSDAVLTSTEFAIVAEEPASVGGFEIGTLLKDVVDGVTVPVGADMDIIDDDGAYVPTKTINFDTIPVYVLATAKVFFEVMAEDGETIITYQLMPDGDPSDAYVTSVVFDVDQDALLISLIPEATSVRTFLNNLVPATGATWELLDKLGYERADGLVVQDDRLVVTAADGETTKTYYLSLLEEVPNYLAYVVSNVYTVDQNSMTISGTDVTGALSVTDFTGNLVPASLASMEVLDNTGTAKVGADMLADEDELEVTAGNGVNMVVYSIVLDHTGIGTSDKGLRVYPNPSTGQFYVEGAEPGSRIRVYNQVGVALLDITVFSGTEAISLDDQPNGFYFITIENGGEALNHYKVIKQ